MTYKYDYPYKDDNIVHNWVTAGGVNSEEEVTSYLLGFNSQKLTTEIFNTWKFKPAKTRDEILKLVEEYRKNRKSR